MLTEKTKVFLIIGNSNPQIFTLCG